MKWSPLTFSDNRSDNKKKIDGTDLMYMYMFLILLVLIQQPYKKSFNEIIFLEDNLQILQRAVLVMLGYESL